MTTTDFTAGWQFEAEGRPPRAVHLPHDAMIGEPRSADAASWAHGGYFPGGRYRYVKTWTPAHELAGREVSLRFEAVYQHSRVLLDGREVGGVVNGYQEFEVRLDPYLTPGTTHTVVVEVDNADLPNSRWYTGSGITRPVWLEVRDRIHVLPGGVSLATTLDGRTATVVVDVPVVSPGPARIRAAVTLSRHGRVAARGEGPVDGGTSSVLLTVEEAVLWSAEAPERYDLDVRLLEDGVERDRVVEKVGLRTIALDPRRGLLVNGDVVLLRGANVHHDHGVLGAATFAASERRRIRILKGAGFNAIRSAHNPASRALLDACDELGMYVLDEAFDGWYDHKNVHDDAERFEEVWRGLLDSMVRKDRLRPSVILYSIGNENGEAFDPRGRRTATALSAELRRLDPTRLVTIGVNLLGATFAGFGKAYQKEPEDRSAKAAPDMTSTALNALSNRFGTLARFVPRLSGADRSTAALWPVVDVAGYNYGTSRYAKDAALHPDRIVVGTETMPGDIARNWALVERLPSLIGDFLWAGWDYIGESGAGTWAYGTRSAPFMKEYPQLTSGMGIHDITGEPGAAVQLVRAVWGVLDAPAIAVRPLDVAPGPVAKTSWRATDAIESWSWAGQEGRHAELEIASGDDEVEVLVNGRRLGRKPAGAAHGFVARFSARYEPGTVEAVGYRAGRVSGRSRLRTAGPARLRLVPETELAADPSSVAYLRLELADDEGVVDTVATDRLTITVTGPAVLTGFGNGAPATTESFTGDSHPTYRGRALAVVRSTGHPGPVLVEVVSTSHGAALLRVDPVGGGTTVAPDAPASSSTRERSSGGSGRHGVVPAACSDRASTRRRPNLGSTGLGDARAGLGRPV